MNSSEMAKKSWEARKKKYGKKGAVELLRRASLEAKRIRLQAKCKCNESENTT